MKQRIVIRRRSRQSLLAMIGTVILLASPARAENQLVVYAYDSLVGKSGWLTSVQPKVEEFCQCKLRIVASGDGGQMTARLRLDQERGKPKAHVVVGVDQYQWDRMRPFAEAPSDWVPSGLDKIRAELRGRLPQEGFLPIDYGVFAFMVDTLEWKKRFGKRPLPATLEDLNAPELRRTILLEDPRTSTPGQAFALYVSETQGAAARAYFTRLRGQWLTLAPGWSQAYGLFLKGEAPLVWSYTTSQAYHRSKGDQSGRYRALVFREGNPLQIEGAFVVKGAHQTEATRAASRRVIEGLISLPAQEALPERQWMLPARQDARLPASFRDVPEASRLLSLPSDEKRVADSLRAWQESLYSGKTSR